MRYGNAYSITGTAYADKSTMVKLLAEKYDGVLCEENYDHYLRSGFHVILRNESRTVTQTLEWVEKAFGLA